MIVLALTATFAFRGGTNADLARTLADWSGQPTVALVQNVSKIRPFTLELTAPGDGKDLTRLLRVKAQIESRAKEGRIGLWNAAWAPGSLRYGMNDSPLPAGLSPMKSAKDGVRQGQVTMRAESTEAIRVAELADLPWSRPLKVHWFLARLWVAPEAKGCGEAAFLGAVADAVGGRLEQTDKEWRIEFDPQAFRPRALTTIAERQKRQVRPDAQMYFETQRLAWSMIPTEDLVQLFKAPSQMRGVRLKGTEIQRCVEYRFKAMCQYANQPVENYPNGPVAAMRETLDQIDPSAPFMLMFGQSITVNIGWSRRGGGTMLG